MPKIHPQMTSPQKMLGLQVQANQIMLHQVSTIHIYVTSIDVRNPVQKKFELLLSTITIELKLSRFT